MIRLSLFISWFSLLIWTPLLAWETPDVIKDHKYDGTQKSLEKIQESVTKAVEEGNLVAIHIMRQTLCGLNKEHLLEFYPAFFADENIPSKIEQSWLKAVHNKSKSDPFFLLVDSILNRFTELIEKNDKVYIDQLKQAGDLGYHDAFAKLGYVYSKGDGAPKDVNKGSEYYKKGLALGSGTSAFRLGELYKKGEMGVRNDWKSAIPYLENGKELGHLACETLLMTIRHSYDTKNYGRDVYDQVMRSLSLLYENYAQRSFYYKLSCYFEFELVERFKEMSPFTKSEALRKLRIIEGLFPVQSNRLLYSNLIMKIIAKSSEYFQHKSYKMGASPQEAPVIEYEIDGSDLFSQFIVLKGADVIDDYYSVMVSLPSTSPAIFYLFPQHAYNIGLGDPEINWTEAKDFRHHAFPNDDFRVGLLQEKRQYTYQKGTHFIYVKTPIGKKVKVRIQSFSYSRIKKDDSYIDEKDGYHYLLNEMVLHGLHPRLTPNEQLLQAMMTGDTKFISQARKNGADFSSLPFNYNNDWSIKLCEDPLLADYLLKENFVFKNYNRGKRPLIYAMVYGLASAKKDKKHLYLERLELMKELGLDLNIKTTSGAHPLKLALDRFCDYEVIRKLVEIGMKPSEMNLSKTELERLIDKREKYVPALKELLLEGW
jgi:TPR repeat protein